MNKKESVIFDFENEGIECLQSFDRDKKIITIEYYVRDYETPLTKGLLRYIKLACKPFVVWFMTNAGVEIHSSEIVGDVWEGMRIIRRRYDEIKHLIN